VGGTGRGGEGRYKEEVMEGKGTGGEGKGRGGRGKKVKGRRVVPQLLDCRCAYGKMGTSLSRKLYQ